MQAFTVKKYVSPLSTLKLGNKNVTAKFKSNNTYTLSYSKYAGKKVKLNFKAKSGWTISADYLEKLGDQKASIIKNNKAIKIKSKNSAIIINATNNKTGQAETCMIIFK